MKKNALVIGATGLLGYNIVNNLVVNGWKVRAIARNVNISSDVFNSKEIEYLSGNIDDEEFLSATLKDVDKVFFFVSSTFPYSSKVYLNLELSNTLIQLNNLLKKMLEYGVKQLVFPSSGGTVYGNVGIGKANETMKLEPVTPYGMGKMMCEDILEYYSKFGISSTILRIGNVYGDFAFRNKKQGVIDIFVQKAITKEIATIWGKSLDSIRDYIFLDDFVDAVVKLSDFDAKGVEKYNLGSGIGTSLRDIIDIINKFSPFQLIVHIIDNDITSAVERIVLDINKIESKINWKPKYSIENGIKETIRRKLSNECSK